MNAGIQNLVQQTEMRDSGSFDPAWSPLCLSPLPRKEALLIGANRKNLEIIFSHLLADSQAAAARDSEQSAVRLSHLSINELSSQSRLPFPSGSFGLVFGHHLSANIAVTAELLAEMRRVTAEMGYLVMVDYVVPGTRLRGKKARLVRQAGDYINAWFRLRNPDHCQLLSADGWDDLVARDAWRAQGATERDHYRDFDTWASQYPQSEKNLIRLRVMLLQAPENVRRFLTPLETGARIDFRLIERCMLAAAA
jgi:Methyltransferase domain